MASLTEKLIRSKAEHHDDVIGELEEISLHQLEIKVHGHPLCITIALQLSLLLLHTPQVDSCSPQATHSAEATHLTGLGVM